MADIFVSYTNSDQRWAFWIDHELKAMGHTTHLHDWETKRGEDVYAWIERRHDSADHVLCVISDDYLNAPYSTLERNAALWQAANKRPGFALFVVVEPCRLPTLSDHLLRCDLFDVPEETARVRLRDFMAKPPVLVNHTFPGGRFAVSNVPIRLPLHFMGRDDVLDAIDDALRRGQEHVAITALHGLRGVGKTTLAVAYAERHRSDFRAIWWIRAQTDLTMRADIVALGVRLGWVTSEEKANEALDFTVERLRHESDGILLIFDNAPSPNLLAPFLPRSGASRALITSNAHAWRGIALPVEVRVWNNEVGADYLVARSGRVGERDAALNLSTALGGLPLAHEQAAAYCERLEVSLAEYLRRFEAAPASLLDDVRHAPTEYYEGLTVAKTFALAIDQAKILHPTADMLLEYAAFLSPEPIPMFLFTEAARNFREPLAGMLEGNGIEEMVATLRSLALIDRGIAVDERNSSVVTDVIRLHRLVSLVAAGRCDSEKRERIHLDLIKAVDAVYPKDLWNEDRNWPRARRLEGAALAVVGDTSIQHRAAESSVADLLSGLGYYQYTVLSNYEQAQVFFERALAIREKIFGAEHVETAKCLNDLGRILQTRYELQRSKSFFERALAIREKILGPEHRDTAATLNDIGRLLRRSSKYAHARTYIERALVIRQRVLGPDHHETASSLNNLGRALQEEGKPGNLDRARQLFERALEIMEQEYGPQHSNTISTMGNLASVIQHQGDRAGARALNERILSTREMTLGGDHPLTAMALSNLAMVVPRNQPEARTLLQRALRIFEERLGPTHRHTVSTLNRFAQVLEEQGYLEDAKRYYNRALTTNEQALGPDNHITNVVRSNLARVGFRMREYEAALALGEIALGRLKMDPGPDHPSTRRCAYIVADILWAVGRRTEATDLRTRYPSRRQRR